MQFLNGRIISTFGFFNCIEAAKIKFFSICSYVRSPFFCFFIKRNPLYSTFICNWLSCILHILASCCNPKIAKSIVRSISIDVIYLSARPFIRHDGPGNPVRSVKHVVYPNNNIAAAVPTCYYLSGVAFPSFNAPTQCSCDRIIGKKGFELLDVWFGHDGNMATSRLCVKECFL